MAIGLDETEVVVAAHDGGDGVEHPGQGIDVAVGVDLEHGDGAAAASWPGAQEPRAPQLALKSSIDFTDEGIELQSCRSRVCRSCVIEETERTLA